MQVQIEDISTVKKRIKVEVPDDKVASQIESAYQELAKHAKVKGFRPGKVPRTMLERLYKQQVEQQVATELIEASYPEALSEAKLEPISDPIVENYDLKAGEGLKFNALVELRPQVEVEGYKGLELEQPKIEITDDMVDTQLEMLREQHADMEDVDEPLTAKMWAHADIEAFCEGNPVKGLTNMGELFRLGEEKEQSELERGISGMRKGEKREITLHLPPNYHQPSLRDKDVVFKVAVHTVKRKVLPPLDDELARELKQESLAKIREQTRQELEAKADATSKRQVRESLVSRLIELSQFEVPESMIEREVDHMVANLKQRLGPRQVDLEDVNVDKVRQNFRKGAEHRARAELILAQIADKEAIEVSDEDVENGINELAADMKEEPERIREFHERANLMGSLRRHLREEKTMEFLLENAVLKEMNATPEATE
jgi:trigger factor